MHDGTMRPKGAWLPGLVVLAVSCVIAATPRAAQDSGGPPRETTVVALASVTAAADGGGQVTPLREPQIVTARLAVPASAALGRPAESASVGPMLWALAAMIAWIAGRRR